MGIGQQGGAENPSSSFYKGSLLAGRGTEGKKDAALAEGVGEDSGRLWLLWGISWALASTLVTPQWDGQGQAPLLTG